jgi:hypothetical protein
MESRMLGNSHVRFGEGDGETCLGNGVKRLIPTPPAGVSDFVIVVSEGLDGVLQGRLDGGITRPGRGELQFGLGGQRDCFAGGIPGKDVLDLAAIAGAVEFERDFGDAGIGEGREDDRLVAGADVGWGRCFGRVIHGGAPGSFRIEVLADA